MHWPGAGSGFFWLTAIFISAFILIPVYFFTGIRNAETRLNTIVTTIILVGATGLQFTMVNIRPPKQQTQIKMYSYFQNDELLKRMQQQNSDGGNKLVADINATAEEIKSPILSDMTD